MEHNALPLVLTYAEAAEQLAKVSERTVRRLVDRGELPVIRIGGRVGIPTAALAEWVSRNAIKCRTEEKPLRTGGSPGRTRQASDAIALVAQLTSGQRSA